jgi:hypothetical protein
MSEFLDRMHEVVKHVRQAQDLMARGPLEYYFGKLVEHSDALLTKFSPIKEGERAVIVQQPKLTGGWSGMEHTLYRGATGRVRSVDYCDGKFVFEFVPDAEYWIDSSGNKQPVTTRHSYSLSEKILVRCPDQGDECGEARKGTE